MNRVLLTIAVLCASATGCDHYDSTPSNKPMDAAADRPADVTSQSDKAPPGDTADAATGDASSALEDRGRYLVNGILACGGRVERKARVELGAKQIEGVVVDHIVEQPQPDQPRGHRGAGGDCCRGHQDRKGNDQRHQVIRAPTDSEEGRVAVKVRPQQSRERGQSEKAC